MSDTETRAGRDWQGRYKSGHSSNPLGRAAKAAAGVETALADRAVRAATGEA
jgi:hypothetical protein